MTPVRKPGRPRDAAVGERVLDAALEVLKDEGFAGLTIEAIADRAGVSKATMYRRWDSKETLLVDAVARAVEAVEIEDTGDIRHDLTAAVRGMCSFVSDTRAGEVFPWLVGEIANGSEIGTRYAAAVIVPRRRMLGELLRAAIERGDLREDIDVATAVDMVMGPVIMRRIAGLLEGSGESWAETVVDS
ncbi:MAG: TetR/AcrR family transcriptional regulator, partial [Acidimicrobiia bacterium]|nr:TetR/AcrR family transcriptional regulator [Acidimicrobiia bacterium]